MAILSSALHQVLRYPCLPAQPQQRLPPTGTCVPIPSEGGSALGELSDGDTRAEPCPGTRSRCHQKGLLELQSKNTKSAFLNELQNLLQWFAPDKEVNNLLPGKERWGVKKERDEREERM